MADASHMVLQAAQYSSRERSLVAVQPRSQGHLTFELQLIVTRNGMPSYPGNEVGSSEFGQTVDVTTVPLKKTLKTLWPLFMDGVQLPQG